MREAAGKAAIWVEPLSTESIRKGMLLAATEGKLVKNLSELGRKEAKLYTWARTARLVKQVYKTVMYDKK
jgi:glycosyltransferase involved in cell wall biosynthesis